MKLLIPYTLSLILFGYGAYTTPAAVKQWRREIAAEVMTWPEAQEASYRANTDAIGDILAVNMPKLEGVN